MRENALSEQQHSALPDPVRIAADLCWAVRSPPLLRECLHSCARADTNIAIDYPDAEFFQELWQGASVPEINASEFAAAGRQRLGIYFEQLWQCWLREQPRWQVLARNLAVREHGITLGELDVVLLHKESQQVEHWELAVKFYLGVGDWSQPANWLGPNQRDTLARKWRHLDQQQARLSSHPAAQKALAKCGVDTNSNAIDRVRVIVKGRLFYPLMDFLVGSRAAFAGAGHECGFWASEQELNNWLQAMPLAERRGLRYQRLHGTEFLAQLSPKRSEDLQALDDFVWDQTVAFNSTERPQALALFKLSGSGVDDYYSEFARGFIVSPSWLEQAMTRLAQDNSASTLTKSVALPNPER